MQSDNIRLTQENRKDIPVPHTIKKDFKVFCAKRDKSYWKVLKDLMDGEKKRENSESTELMFEEQTYEDLKERHDIYNSNRLEDDISFSEFLKEKIKD